MRIRILNGRFAVGLIAAGAVASMAAPARADTVCGSTNAGWNAPNGAAVFEVAPGIIADVLTSLGESRSHSMLSHGPDGWVTHATSIHPVIDNSCHNPIDQPFMAASTPGLSTIDQGAAYTFLYNNGGAPTSLTYRNPITYPNIPSCPAGQSCYLSGGGIYEPLGPVVGNNFLGSPDGYSQLGYVQMGSGSNTVWGLTFTPVFGTAQQIYYGWSQYMNIGSTAQGFPQPQRAGNGYGVVCSTSLAMWQHDALWNQPAYTGDITPRTYPSSAVTTAAWKLWNDVHDECAGMLNIDGWSNWGSAIGSASCNFVGVSSVCSNAANQVVNAFADDGFVNDTAAEWQGVVSNNSAYSISPDAVACANSNGTGAACGGGPLWVNPGESIWGADIDNTVQWNNGGSSYGCWQQ